MFTPEELKQFGSRLRTHLAQRHNIALSHSHSIEAASSAAGFRDWNTANAVLSHNGSEAILSGNAGLNTRHCIGAFSNITLRRRVFYLTPDTNTQALTHAAELYALRRLSFSKKSASWETLNPEMLGAIVGLPLFPQAGSIGEAWKSVFGADEFQPFLPPSEKPFFIIDQADTLIEHGWARFITDCAKAADGLMIASQTLGPLMDWFLPADFDCWRIGKHEHTDSGSTAYQVPFMWNPETQKLHNKLADFEYITTPSRRA